VKISHAGAIIVGRTNTPAFSMRLFTGIAARHTSNPRDRTRTACGSSGGAGIGAAAWVRADPPRQ